MKMLYDVQENVINIPQENDHRKDEEGVDLVVSGEDEVQRDRRDQTAAQQEGLVGGDHLLAKKQRRPTEVPVRASPNLRSAQKFGFTRTTTRALSGTRGAAGCEKWMSCSTSEKGSSRAASPKWRLSGSARRAACARRSVCVTSTAVWGETRI
ncbi:ORF176 [Saltwater crocodilepox virus]|nr:ORF176 [Saltwater crocodilepox virus]QGT48545.1 ORF176 [Saltwater crocodilepox virus]QGT48759.1 ORF176 [Saltwater crocodilepox virus]QGT48971.1 ORF176 [Saltwater crocodilepox virus]QGT49184.1 ORF176 [Saltwater crocodilepox virus]